MNKQLLSATALVAVALMGASGAAVAQQKASKPTISVGGYYWGGVRFTDNGDSVGGLNTGGFAAFNDSEIHFNMSGMLDNGIRIGGRWELEGDEADAFIDEAFMFVRGGFGEVRLGEEDGAAHLMVLGYQGSWATSVGLNLNFDIDELVPDPAGFNVRRTGARLDLDDADNSKVTYFSPKFGGFQLGASYARDVSGPVGAQNADAEVNQSVVGGRSGEDWWSFAANFDRKFGNFRVGVALGYVQQQYVPGANRGLDATEWGGGVLVEFGPVRLSMGAKTTDDYRNAAGTVSHDGEVYDLGARFTFGAHQIGAAYSTYSTPGTIATAGDDEVDMLWFTHSMSLGPGVAWKNTLAWADWDGEGAGLATADNDGWGVATNIALSF